VNEVPEILEAARKHGVADEDIRHAYFNAITDTQMDENFTMVVGGDRAGNLIEVGYVNREGSVSIVHAMRPARPRFLRLPGHPMTPR
jgi:hypothetical protein